MANCADVMARMLHLCKFTTSFAIAGYHGKRHTIPAHKLQAVSDWLNLHSEDHLRIW